MINSKTVNIDFLVLDIEKPRKLYLTRKSNPGCETYPAHFSPPVSVLRLKRTHTSGNSGSFEDEHQARGRNLRIPTTPTSSTSFLIQNQIIQNVQFKQESEGMLLFISDVLF